MPAQAARPSFIDLYTPKLVTILREGYGLADLKADAIAGLTVAIVALPLSMAIAIASGVDPGRGLITAIVGGFFVSALGGSRFQIGGPAGAFIVLVYSVARQHGVEGVLLATFLSGVILLAIGLLRIGTFIKYIPFPVTVGFSAGIGAIIFCSQLKELFGLTLAGPEPGPFLPKLIALGSAAPTISPATTAVSVMAIAIILAARHWRPNWPSFLIATVVTSVLAPALGLHVATLGTRFGGIPNMLPAPHLPTFSLATMRDILPAAVSFAILAGIESLLSAVVADSMTGRRHRSNAELMAQGVANIASSLFGGFCVTGLIARTATNVRAGGRSPAAGILHSAFVLLVMVGLGRYASYIPVASLAAVLVVVAWNMAERHQFATLVRASWGDAVVLLATFLLVVFDDLTTGILTGFGISALLFLHRMAQSVEVETGLPMVEEDRADNPAQDKRSPYDVALATDRDVTVTRISGAFFFAAAASVAVALDRIGQHPRATVIDFSAVSIIDSTAAALITGFARTAQRRGAQVYLAGARPSVRRALLSHGARPPLVRYRTSVAEALTAAHGRLALAAPEPAGTAKPGATLAAPS